MTVPLNSFDFNPGSGGPLVHLAHANGFPPATYGRALEPLFPQHHVLSFYARPFWSAEPPKTLKHWSQMADDLIGGLEGLGARGITGIGHSLGGTTTLYAAVKRPDLFSRIVLIDPTLLSPKLLWQIKLMKCFGLDARSYLVKGALRRKREWESARAAYDYFRGRRLFKDWTDGMVETYSGSVTGPSPDGGVRLIYPPEWEARIYRTIPTDVWKYARQLQQPTLVIRGELSNTFTADSEKAFRKANPRAAFAVVPGAGHLVPQEKPEETGKLIAEFLNRSEETP